MHKLIYSLDHVGEYDTFEEAFVELFKRLTKDIKKGTSWQMVETSIWIESPDRELPMLFYEARDRACDLGILIDGKLNPEYEKV